MADPLLAALRFVHITAAVLWMGGGVLHAMFVVPASQRAGPAGPAFMGTLLTKTSFLWWLPLTGTLTVLAGAWLYVQMGFGGPPFETRALTVLNIAVMGALLAYGVGMLVTFPAAKRLRDISAANETKKGPPSEGQMAEIGTLQRRLLLATRLWSVGVLVAVFGMSTYQFI